MNTPSHNRIAQLFGIDLPVIQAPMAGASTPAMAIAVSEAGGLGSLPAALYSVEEFAAALAEVRAGTKKPVNVNFFSHVPPAADPVQMMKWRALLAPYYVEHGIDTSGPIPTGNRAPFNEEYCAVVEAFRPEVVSFHFGLPEETLLERVRRTGARIISSATSVAEARCLEKRGVDAIIAMGFEAGGHRGNFLTDDLDIASAVGTFALVPQIVDAVSVPVIAAGGIADQRGVRAALALGAEAVQVGTAYLFTPEAKVSAIHRKALKEAADNDTALTNLFTGRPARGIFNRLMREVGPISTVAPAFPTSGGALIPLRKAAENEQLGDFTNLWSGQAGPLSKEMSSAALTRYLGEVFTATREA
ncbi:Nitronate monooxygenase [Cupriavidus pampae]|uniref:Propionate 3-nitronate monooxygenase n=1 Tax=Cupriavidus pampae TaxID=659251 RepID=A0ABN7YXX9_9BURK|nr:nitronate monooxygenase [Cupriavidus pampae]CAG9177285.1 Nitronate monooxygenase [Cupriavidus pampae]